MGSSQDGKGVYSENNVTADTEGIASDRTAFSGPLVATIHNNIRGSKKGTRFNLSPEIINGSSGDDHNESSVVVTVDSVLDPSVQSSGGGEALVQYPESSLPGRETLKHNRSSSVLSSSFGNIPWKIKEFVSSRRSDTTKSAAPPARKGLTFIPKTGWPPVLRRFNSLKDSTDSLLHCSDFGECIGMNKDCKEFGKELFRALARKHNITGDSINDKQLKVFWDQISNENFESSLQTIFDMVDKDGDGRLTESEVSTIISLSASANKLHKIKENADKHAALIMQKLDTNNDKFISIDELEKMLLEAANQSVGVRDSGTRSKSAQENNPLQTGCKKFMYFLMDNWQRVWIMMLWVGIVAGLFAYKFVQYRNKAAYHVMGYCVCVAKGAAETLKFNMALILLPVCRNTITWLRNKTKLGLVVPFDDNFSFHQVIAVGICVGVMLHGGAHLTCDFPRLLHATEEEYEPMKPYIGEQPPNYWWFLKGVEGVTGIIMVVLMSIAFTLATPYFRRKKADQTQTNEGQHLRGFNAFWYSHHLFIIVYTLLIVHGIRLYLTKTWYQKTTWMYVAVPILLYTCERLIRAFRSRVKDVDILKNTAVYPGNVLALHMSKPEGFKYKSGQYMFVKCAKVSPFEWHPFSITSAPGDDYLSVHIKREGDWTGRLHTVFKNASYPNFPEIKIDGPYGAPAQDYERYDVVLLVGLGIGATPMISIAKDIINKMKSQVDPDLENGGANSSATPKNKHCKGSFKTRKAYFYWVTREQDSFEWFGEIMNKVAEMDKKKVIEMHTYLTSVYGEGDARSAFIAMLQSLQHDENGVDVVSGTRVKTHFAKPTWRQVYQDIADHHPDSEIGVFYCGPPTVTKVLKQLALEFSHQNTSTNTKFEFHKENF